MPIAYSISPSLDLLYAQYSGDIRIELFPDIYQVYLQDSDYRLGRPELIDMSGATATDLGFEEIKTILMGVERALPKNTPPIKTTILAPSDVAFGLARIYQSLSDYSGLLEVSIHRTEAGTMAGLGLPFDDIKALLAEGGFGPMRRGRIET